jgi:hypothetical protein
VTVLPDVVSPRTRVTTATNAPARFPLQTSQQGLEPSLLVRQAREPTASATQGTPPALAPGCCAILLAQGATPRDCATRRLDFAIS